MVSSFALPEPVAILTARKLRRRVSQVQAIEDPKLRRKARARLSYRVLQAIAEERTSPTKAAAIVLELFE